MFAVPEVLWSPIANFYYGVIRDSNPGSYYHEFRDNFLTNGDNTGSLKLVIVTQFLALMVVFVILIKSKFSNSVAKIIAILLLSLLIFCVGFVTLFMMSFNLQIG